MTNFTEKNEIEIFKWRFISGLTIAVALLFIILFGNKCAKPAPIRYITTTDTIIVNDTTYIRDTIKIYIKPKVQQNEETNPIVYGIPVGE